MQQYNSLKPNIPIALCFIFFFASLSLSLSLSHSLSHTHKSKNPYFFNNCGWAWWSKRGHWWLHARIWHQMPKGNYGHEVRHRGQREEEKWVSSIPITHRNISTSTLFGMGDWDSILANILVFLDALFDYKWQNQFLVVEGFWS